MNKGYVSDGLVKTTYQKHSKAIFSYSIPAKKFDYKYKKCLFKKVKKKNHFGNKIKKFIQ